MALCTAMLFGNKTEPDSITVPLFSPKFRFPQPSFRNMFVSPTLRWLPPETLENHKIHNSDIKPFTLPERSRMAVSVCQPFVGRDNRIRPMTENNSGRRMKATLIGGITTTKSQDNHETLAIKIIIPPKPRGMNPGPNSTADDDTTGTFISTFPVIQSDPKYSKEYDARMSSSQSTIDVKSLMGQDEDLAASKLPFVWKLYEMLEDVEINGQEDIVSWIDKGRGFKVHHMQKFVDEIMPQYFRQTKYKSFQRQLYFYDFQRVASGADVGAYKHPNFLKGVKTLCLSMMPKKTSRRRSGKGRDSEMTQPDVMGSSCEAVICDNTNAKLNTESLEEGLMEEESESHSMRSFDAASFQPSRHDRSSSSESHKLSGETVPKPMPPGDGDTVFVFGNRRFHFVEVAFDDIYPPFNSQGSRRPPSRRDYV